MNDGQTPSDSPTNRQPGPLVEDEDFIINAEGLLVFTASYLRKRGTCCGNKCRNCPFGWREVPAWKRVAGERQPPLDERP